MSELTLTKTRLRNGVWEGIIGGAGRARPDIRALYLDQPVDGVDLVEDQANGKWNLSVPVPKHAIADGVHTFLIIDEADNTKLGDFTVIAGETITDDLNAEVALLRAELDMLKRAFRRHCLETT